MADYLWKLEGVELSAGGHEKRLHGIDFEILRGVTAVVGHSGSGKTSLLNLLTGFEKPDKGIVHRNIAKENFASELFWAPHNGGLWPHLTVEEHLGSVTGKNSCEESVRLLELFELDDKKPKRPGELSRGECSRLSIARAIAANPAVLVFDEPLVNIDSSRRRKLWKAIVEETKRKNKSLVYATHSPAHIIGSANKVICISSGCVIFDDTTEKLYLAPPTKELASYLGEINWFDNEECRLWLKMDSANDFSLRPEHIKIFPDTAGNFKVEGYEFDGELAGLELVCPESGASKRFFTVSDGIHFVKGETVSIKTIKNNF